MEIRLPKDRYSDQRPDTIAGLPMGCPVRTPLIGSESKDRPVSGDAFVREPFKGEIAQELLQRLSAIATPLEYARGGELIYTEGDSAPSVFFAEEGLIRISRLTESGRRQILAFRGRGDLFGLPDDGRHANSAETVSAARVSRFAWVQLQDLMADEPGVQQMLFLKLANHVRDAQKRILMLGQQNIHQRLSSFLLDLMGLPEFYDAARRQLTIPVNRFDLADYLGTAPESTARAFARLESEGLVRRKGSRTIEIRAPEGLRTLKYERRRSQT